MFEQDQDLAEAMLDALAPDPKPGWLGPLRVTEVGDAVVREPLWSLDAARNPVLVEDATDQEARDAWEHAAVWTQAQLDEAETMFRVQESGRTITLLRAYRTALEDLSRRYGAVQGRRDSAGVQLFFAQVGLQLGMHPTQVAHRVDVADLAERFLPRTWRVYTSWNAPWRAIELAVRAADGMTGDAWEAYDTAVAALFSVAPTYRPEDRIPIGALPRKLRSIREDVQRDTMIGRAKRTAEQRTTTIEHCADGRSILTIEGPTVVVTAMDATLHKAAIASHREGETRGLAQLRFDIARDLILDGAKIAADPDSPDLAVPGRPGVTATVVVTVPVLTLLGIGDEPARLEGVGPIDPDTARRIAADAPSFRRLLTHPITGVRLDLDRNTYAPPADLRLWVKLRDEVCRFPGCERPADRCDIDHAKEWHDGGITAAANLVSLSRPHHTIKSSGLVEEALRPDDGVDWALPWGRTLHDPPPRPMDPVPPGVLEDDCPF